jgi:hypothetical protein
LERITIRLNQAPLSIPVSRNFERKGGIHPRAKPKDMPRIEPEDMLFLKLA